MGRNYNYASRTHWTHHAQRHRPKLYGFRQLGRQDQKESHLCNENTSQTSPSLTLSLHLWKNSRYQRA